MSDRLNWPAFQPADFLLPKHCDMSKWSVVACDQYTSEPEYWKRVEAYVGDAPSTLRLILPEVYLGDGHVAEKHEKIRAVMQEALESDCFQVYPDALFYVERWLSTNQLRRGLVGVVDLEAYDYNRGSSSLIRATEGTVLSRVPPRVAIRREASLELSHVMMLIDDRKRQVIEPLAAETDQMEQVYDFDLMEQGGHISGYLLTEEQKSSVCEQLNDLMDPEGFARRYDAPNEKVMLYAVGDGNHSLAAARDSYLEKKHQDPERDWSRDPARYAMVEVVNLHDESLQFEAIHRVCFSVDPEQLLEAFLAYYPGAHYGEGEGHAIGYVWEKGRGQITVPSPDAQLEVGTLQGFLDHYFHNNKGYIDYVHGADVVERLAVQPGNIGFLLPAMGKNQLFKSVIHDGALPRKTFSMGHAQDKRYYLEARKIK